MIGVSIFLAGVALVTGTNMRERELSALIKKQGYVEKRYPTQSPPPTPGHKYVQEFTQAEVVPESPLPIAVPSPVISFVGPRGNIPNDSPTAAGFWSFAIPAPGALSRSGQPLASEFTWLKEHGWKSIVNLRMDNEYEELSDDSALPGFKDLNFNYLRLPIPDGGVPSDEQSMEFLKFVTDPQNQPVHIHCRGGYGRTSALVALYRYSIKRWPMEKAIEESRSFNEGMNDDQKAWLEKWAQTHEPGTYQLSH